jgi:hypothetical protein
MILYEDVPILVYWVWPMSGSVDSHFKFKGRRRGGVVERALGGSSFGGVLLCPFFDGVVCDHLVTFEDCSHIRPNCFHCGRRPLKNVFRLSCPFQPARHVEGNVYEYTFCDNFGIVRGAWWVFPRCVRCIHRVSKKKSSS